LDKGVVYERRFLFRGLVKYLPALKKRRKKIEKKEKQPG
jgi:hypothetical protein